MERGISGKPREFSPSCPVQTQLRFQSRRITKRMRNEEAVYSRKINWTEMPTVDALQNNWQEPLRAKFFSVRIPQSSAVISRYDMLPRQFWIRPPPFRCHSPILSLCLQILTARNAFERWERNYSQFRVSNIQSKSWATGDCKKRGKKWCFARKFCFFNWVSTEVTSFFHFSFCSGFYKLGVT